MSTDKKPDVSKDTSASGREEEVIKNNAQDPEHKDITGLPLKDDKALNETEGERRFKEGIVNNSDTDE